MKIILSPSKGKQQLQEEKGEALLFPEITQEILSLVQNLSKEELGKKLSLKGQALDDLYDFYGSYDRAPQSPAYKVYDGVAFRALGLGSLGPEDFQYGQDHLLILSALYGCIKPLTAIKAYRLDMNNSLGGPSLYKLWQEAINGYVEGEDYIFNLASKEYSKILKDKSLINFEFLDFTKGQWRVVSHNAKHMRGRMARYIIEHKIESPDQLRGIQLEGYTYCPNESSEEDLIFTRNL